MAQSIKENFSWWGTVQHDQNILKSIIKRTDSKAIIIHEISSN